jgi:hypothetical protein
VAGLFGCKQNTRDHRVAPHRDFRSINTNIRLAMSTLQAQRSLVWTKSMKHASRTVCPSISSFMVL